MLFTLLPRASELVRMESWSLEARSFAESKDTARQEPAWSSLLRTLWQRQAESFVASCGLKRSQGRHWGPLDPDHPKRALPAQPASALFLSEAWSHGRAAAAQDYKSACITRSQDRTGASKGIAASIAVPDRRAPRPLCRKRSGCSLNPFLESVLRLATTTW